MPAEEEKVDRSGQHGEHAQNVLDEIQTKEPRRNHQQDEDEGHVETELRRKRNLSSTVVCLLLKATELNTNSTAQSSLVCLPTDSAYLLHRGDRVSDHSQHCQYFETDSDLQSSALLKAQDAPEKRFYLIISSAFT